MITDVVQKVCLWSRGFCETTDQGVRPCQPEVCTFYLLIKAHSHLLANGYSRNKLTLVTPQV